MSNAWARALWLHERISPELTDTFDPDAERVVHSWTTPFLRAHPTLWAKRLAAEGLSTTSLAYLLQEPTDTLLRRQLQIPEWVHKAAGVRLKPPLKEPLAPADIKQSFFGHAAGSLLTSALDQLHDGFSTRARAGHIHADVLEGLTAELIQSVGTLTASAFITELHIAALRGEIHGETSEARFQDFVRRWNVAPPNILRTDYPLLVRRILETSDAWVQSTMACLDAVISDWQLLEQAGLIASDDQVLKIGAHLGDPHRGLRAVRTIHLASGTRVVFKPRSLALDSYFQNVLSSFNEHGPELALPILRGIDCGDHGWQEFVEHLDCSTDDQLKRFYTRQGYYLALLLVLNGTDIHHENQIACVDNPYIIDLETIAQPKLRSDRFDEGFYPSSILTGLLPLYTKVGNGYAVDLSALGSRGGQRTVARNQLIALNSDEIHIGEREALTSRPSSSPVPGVEEALQKWGSAIGSGFEEAYNLLASQPAALIRTLRAIPEQAAIRIVLRPTKYYRNVIRNTLHPSVQNDALQCERVLDELWTLADETHTAAAIIRSEQSDIRRLDVPYFTTRPTSYSIWNSDGVEIADAIHTTATDNLAFALQSLGPLHLARELWLIDAALSTVGSFRTPPRGAPTFRNGSGAARESAETLSVAAADWLLQMSAGSTTWYQRSIYRSGVGSIEPADAAFYDGLPGIATFLAYAGAVTGCSRFATAAVQVVAKLRAYAARGGPASSDKLGLDGDGGLVFGLTHIGAVLRLPEAIDLALNVSAKRISFDGDADLDLIHGVSGWIKCILPLYQHTGDDRILRSLTRAGDVLRTHLTAGSPPATRMLRKSGYAHGAAGLIDALTSMFVVTGDEGFITAAEVLLDSERRLFREEQGNWLEDGDDEAAPRFGVSWCHGAPGIGLSRLNVLGVRNIHDVLVDIDNAVRTTLNEFPGNNDCLCHGELGNLEFLSEASHVRADPQLRSRVDAVADAVCLRISRHGMRGGVYGSRQVLYPGFMTGAAGIGYGLLRLCHPELPSLLRFAPPDDFGG